MEAVARDVGHVDWSHPFWSQVAPEALSGCWLWTGTINKKLGYGSSRFEGETMGAHRVAWCLLHGRPTRTMYVCHHCDNHPCVNPAHLFLGTQRDNMRDCARKGRTSRRATNFGETHNKAHLTEAGVLGILSRFHGGERIAGIARSLGVHEETIGDVCRRKTWKHVPWPRATPPSSQP